MSIIGSDRKRPRIRCDGFRNSRICDNSTIFYMNDIEDLVLHSLIELLSKDEYIDFYIEKYCEERELKHTDNANREKDLSSKIADLHTKRIRIMEKIASGLISDEDARDFLNKLRDDLQQAEEALAESPWGTFTVAGGAMTAINITNPGLGSGTTPPTLSFTASAGLTGASATAVVGNLIAAQKTYWALSTDGAYLQLYQNDGTATPAVVANAALGAKAMIDALASLTGSRIANTVPVTGTGTALANANVYFEPTSLNTFDEFVTGLSVAMSADGVVRIVVSKLEDDSTLSNVGIVSQTFNALAGVSTISGLEISKPAGCVIGIQAVSGGYPLYTTGIIPNGGSRWHSAAIPTSHTAKTVTTTNGIQWSAVLTGEVTIKARRTDAQGTAIGKGALVGWSSIVASGTNTPANYSTVQQVSAAADSYITGI
ncbi:MAG: hypothetical protein J0J15_29265, partial [Mesorhizobium sp.]|nr:hypothetical protein [Mesorhizobium sp.]